MEDVYRAQRAASAKSISTPEEILAEALEEERARVKPAEPEVKYIPNRAERRRREQAARRSVRRGERAAERKIRELSKGMTPAQIARATDLAKKSLGRG